MDERTDMNSTPSTKILSELHRHAAGYHRVRRDFCGSKSIGPRGLFYSAYRTLRVYVKSGLPLMLGPDEGKYYRAAGYVLAARTVVTKEWAR